MQSPRSSLALVLTCVSIASFSGASQAFNPDEGAEPDVTPAPRYHAVAHYQPLPSGIVPHRYYAPVAPAAAPAPAFTATAPVAAPVMTPPPVIAAAPEIRQMPAKQPEIVSAPAPIMPPATPTYGYAPTPSMPAIDTPATQVAVAEPSYRANNFSVGLEAFYDHYEEPNTFPDLNERAYYGSIDLGYAHYFSPSVYADIEQRVSRGSDRYKSSQGHISDIPQWELDTRMTGGYDTHFGAGHHIKTYMGLGTRYFIDEAKGKQTNLGVSGYERRIFQLYAPVGVTYEFPAYGLTFAPNVEIDPLLYGSVQSRLENITGLQEFNNRQNAGFGWRAELMMGETYANGMGWQFGPFVRYWDIQDSEADHNAIGTGIEPKNTRLQAGAKLKMTF